jgi:hypothetical protein
MYNITRPLSLLVFTLTIVLASLAPLAAEEPAPQVTGQTVYVPAYSHIYHSNGDSRLLLTVNLSIRNVSPSKPITVTAVDYYDTAGGHVRHFVTKPFTLGPFGSENFIVPEKDDTGGSGANFIVEWQADQPVSPPIVETVMIGSQSQLGISFTSRGQAIRK